MYRDKDPLRPLIESAVILLAFIFVIVLLDRYGRHHVRYAASPVVKVIASPRSAFLLWRENQLHGRTLLLLDRYLNADEKEPMIAYFEDEDFATPPALEKFCSALQKDGFLNSLAGSCSTAVLNRLLESRYLYKQLISKKGIHVTGDLARKIDAAEGYRDTFESLAIRQRPRLLLINRDVMEMAYPGLCPERGPYGLTAENYNFLAIKYGLVRKILHVVPEASWSEVKRNLEASPWATRDGPMFRINAFEGTPVTVTRISDVPRLSEPVIVNFNTDPWEPGEIRRLVLFLSKGGLKSDFITVSGRSADEIFKRLSLNGNTQG